jgi:protein PhnA
MNLAATFPPCPACNSALTYHDGKQLACPECAHEWVTQNAETSAELAIEGFTVKDAFGNALKYGDTIILIKDLKLKGSSTVVKGGTKVKIIRLIDSDHNIDSKLDGVGTISLKSEFVKKV